jgi:hypothetical protein
MARARDAMPRDNRSALSFVFGFIGGVLILTGIVVFLPSYSYGYTYGPFLFGFYGLALGVVSGIFVIIAAATSFYRPEHGVMWGVVEIVFGSLSILSLGGFLIGMALSITGGALAVVVGSSGVAPAPVARMRACTNCGMLIPMEFAHCPHCGQAVAPVRPRG